MKKILLGSCFLMTAWFAGAQQRYELTVKEAVDLAFKNVIQIKNAQADYRFQEARNKEISGQALPQITGNLGTQYYIKTPQILFPMDETGTYTTLKRLNLIPQSETPPAPMFVPFSLQQPWNFSAGATLQQLLFQPDVFVGLQARQTALDLSAAQIEQVKEVVKDSAYKRYYAILIAAKQLQFLEDGIRRLQKLYRDDSIMFVNGFAERLELDRVRVQINNLQTMRNQVASAVEISYAVLKFATGISQKDTVVLKEDLTSANIRDNLLDEGFEYEKRAEIRTLSQVKKLQELDVKRHKLGYIPTVAAAANYSIIGQGPEFITSSKNTWFRTSYIGLNVNVPIFDGFQRRSRIRQAQITVEKTDNNINLVKQGIDLEQVITRQSLLTALNNLDIQERNIVLAEKVYNTTKLKFEQGVTTSSFEVIQAENDLQTAQSNYFNALYDAIVSKISYQRSIGKLE